MTTASQGGPSPVRWRHYIVYSATSQAFNAGTNVLMLFLLARSLTRHQFSAQAIALTMLPLVVAGFRGVCLEPAVVHGTSTDVHRHVFADSVTVAVLCTLSTFTLAVVAGGSARIGAILAVGAGFAIIEESGRWLLARNDRPQDAAAADIGWGVVQVAVLGAGVSSALVVSAAWAAGAAASAGMAWWAMRRIVRAGKLVVRPAEPQPPGRRRHQRNRGRRNWHWGFEYVTAASAPQLVLLLAPLTGGVDVAGALSAAMSLCGVATVITGGAQQAAAGRLRRIGSAREMRRWALVISGSIGAAVIIFTVPLLFVPSSVGIRLLGENWGPARAILPPIIVQRVAMGAALGLAVVTRRIPTYRVGFWLRIPITVLTVAGAVFGAAVSGAEGAALALAAGGVVTLVIWGTMIRVLTGSERAMREIFDPVPVPVPVPTPQL